MTWWLWVLFWVAFWAVACAYLARRTWRVWPHARAFTTTLSEAWGRIEAARGHANATSSAVTGREQPTRLERSVLDELAWNEPASVWRERRRVARRRRRELHLDDHAEVWASWHRPVD